jgi:replicative DNA helicase
MVGNIPNSQDAEKAVLGCIIKSGKQMDICISSLISKDFFYDSNQKIYSIMERMYKKNVPIDLISIANSLRNLSTLNDVGGITYLSELLTQVVTFINFKYYVAIVKEKSNKRKLLWIANELSEKAYDDSKNSYDVMKETEDKLFESIFSDSENTERITSIADEGLSKIEDIYKNKGKITGIETGYSNLDAVLNGLQKQNVIILAARPSMGKSAFAGNLAANISKRFHTAIFSLEMTKNELLNRMIAAEGLVDFEKIKNGNLNNDEWVKVGEAAANIACRKLFINDTGSINITKIKAECKKLKIQEGLDVVFIDYLQLITGNKKGSREQEISEISRDLKSLAKELNITVISLAQLSRACEQRDNKRPMLSDLRESGSIEQDADIVMFLYRDEYYNQYTEDKNIAEVIISKNRNGRTGLTKLLWMGNLQLFGSIGRV